MRPFYSTFVYLRYMVCRWLLVLLVIFCPISTSLLYDIWTLDYADISFIFFNSHDFQLMQWCLFRVSLYHKPINAPNEVKIIAQQNNAWIILAGKVTKCGQSSNNKLLKVIKVYYFIDYTRQLFVKIITRINQIVV